MMRWVDRLSRHLSRRRAPEFEVCIRRVFVLPTRHGLMVALSIFGVFAISVRIQNNMLLLMAVALFVIFTLSLLWAGQNLRGLHLSARHDGQVVAGETVMMAVRLAADRPAYDIRIDTGGGAKQAASQSASQSAGQSGDTDHLLSFSPTQRGRHPLPRVRIETQFPFGLSRAWCWISPAEVLVAPVPDYGSALALLGGATCQGAAEGRDEDGADSLQDWVPGTPESRISWKRYAATDRLLEKTGDASGGAVLTIDYDRVAHLGHERALSAMTGAVLRAARAGRPFHFRLNQLNMKHVTPQAVRVVLDALALA